MGYKVDWSGPKSHPQKTPPERFTRRTPTPTELVGTTPVGGGEGRRVRSRSTRSSSFREILRGTTYIGPWPP